jgi:DNA topoisomerase-1
MDEKFTQPPWRYSQASLLAKMEEEKIGTKATRADTIATLFKRNYISTGAAKRKKSAAAASASVATGSSSRGGGGIEATELGFAVIESARQHAPTIISTEMTRAMEEQLEGIEKGTKDVADVIGFAAEKLIESLATFREHGATIGRQIGTASASAQSNQNNTIIIGSCPICKKGQLRIIRSRATKKRFVGCSNYSSGCRASAPLPQKGGIKALQKPCDCGWPKISVAFGGSSRDKQQGQQQQQRQRWPRSRWTICVNMQCPYKEDKSKAKEEKAGKV